MQNKQRTKSKWKDVVKRCPTLSFTSSCTTGTGCWPISLEDAQILHRTCWETASGRS
jgi:hypothetical protein